MSANSNLPPGPANPNGPGHPDPADLTLHAMQLLTGEEAADLADHLERCPLCRDEFARIVGDLATCALAVDLESPPELARQRLLQQVAREKKNVPIAQSQPEPERPLTTFGHSSGSAFSADTHPAKPRAGHALRVWSGWVIAAGLAVALSFLYGDRTALRSALASQDSEIRRLDAGAASAHQLLDALTDPTALRVTLTATPQPKFGPIAGLTYDASRGSLVFLASDLDPLQPHKTYELWLIPQDGAAPIPAGTFHPDQQGNASIVLPDLPRGIAAKAFGVTIENEGGSQTPTLPILMAGS